jgi:hypothetical protein
MKTSIFEPTLRDLQRMTALARATEDAVIRADYYRLAERCREYLREPLPHAR